MADAADASEPGIVSQLLKSNPLTQVAGAGKDAISAIHQGVLANTDVNTNGTTAKTGRPETDADALETRNSLNRFTLGAQQGAQGAAQTEENLASPQGEAIKNTGNSFTDQAQFDNTRSALQRQNDLDQSHQNLIGAEDDLSNSASKATIDPNQYLNGMGVDKKILTGLGLALSGIGSGLAGQPNMAMDMLQKNIDRNIAAQKQNYINAYNQAQGHLAASQSAKERAQVNIAAQQMAATSVLTGTNVALQGLQTQISGQTALDRYSLLANTLQQGLAKAKNEIDQNYISGFQSNDIQTTNIYGNMAKAASGYLKPKNQPHSGFSAPAPSNRATDMQKGVTPVEAPQAPTPTEQPIPDNGGGLPRYNKSEKKTFLDKLSENGSKLAGGK